MKKAKDAGTEIGTTDIAGMEEKLLSVTVAGCRPSSAILQASLLLIPKSNMHSGSLRPYQVMSEQVQHESLKSAPLDFTLQISTMLFSP